MRLGRSCLGRCGDAARGRWQHGGRSACHNPQHHPPSRLPRQHRPRGPSSIARALPVIPGNSLLAGRGGVFQAPKSGRSSHSSRIRFWKLPVFGFGRHSGRTCGGAVMLDEAWAAPPRCRSAHARFQGFPWSPLQGGVKTWPLYCFRSGGGGDSRDTAPYPWSAGDRGSGGALAAGAHVLGGGALPAPEIVLALTGLVLVSVIQVTARDLSLGRIAAVLGGGQVSLHEAFNVLSTGAACHSPISPAAHEGDHGGALCLSPALAESAHTIWHGNAGFAMTMAHLLAVAVTAVLISRAEAALWQVVAWLRPLTRNPSPSAVGRREAPGARPGAGPVERRHGGISRLWGCGAHRWGPPGPCVPVGRLLQSTP